MTFDEMLKQAFEETAEERAEQMLQVEKKHRFSLSYRLWERKFLKDLRRGKSDKRWTLKKARFAVTAMTIALSLIVVGGTAYAAVAITGRYRFEDNTDYSKILIEKHPSDKTTFEEYYGLPEEDGWELTEYDINFFSVTLIYNRGKTKVIFDQNLIHEGNMGHINTEKAKLELISLYEEDDGFILNFGEEASICWIYDDYLLEINGNITKDEAIKLAYSTKIINLPKKY